MLLKIAFVFTVPVHAPIFMQRTRGIVRKAFCTAPYSGMSLSDIYLITADKTKHCFAKM